MNLVKAQELAKSMPPQELEKYANGFAPNLIPPWLATGEMQAQMQRRQQMQNMMGAAQGPQPSVKEQIEQKANLMGLQLAQQRMAQGQQMTAPRQPGGPVPEGTPEPEAQPEPEMMMAGGGLAQMPVRFNFDGGGIVAFSGEDGDSEVEGKSSKLRQLTQRELAEEYNRKRWAQQAEDEAARSPEAKKDSEGIRKALAMVAGLPIEALKTLVSAPGYGFSKDEPQAPRPAAQATAADMGMPTDVGMPASTNVASMRQPAPVQRPAGLPQALPGQTTGAPTRLAPVAAAPAAPVAAAMPTIPGLNDPAAQAAVTAAMKAPDQAALIAEEKARREAMGVTGRGGEEQEARIQAARDLYEKSRPSGLDDLIRVFGQAGQYKGLSGTGPAYTAMQAQKRAEDLKMQQQEMEQRNLIDTTRRTEGIAAANKVADVMSKMRDTSATTGASVLGHQMAGNVQLANQASQNATQMQIAKERNLNAIEVANIQAASANRPGETERMLMAYGALKAKDPAAAEEFMRNIERVKTGSRGQTAQEALSIKRQGLVEKNEAYKNATQQYYFTKDPAKKAQAKAIIDEIERKEGIVSDMPGSIQSLVEQYAR